MKPITNSRLGSKRGSVLVVALILGIGITLAIGSFIALTVNTSKLSQRSFHANSCVNLAEAGLEEAMYALNNSNWTGWATHGSGFDNKYKMISNVDLGQGMRGQTMVVVFNATISPTPTIVSEGKSFPSIGPVIAKQLEIKVRRKSFFATGMVAKDTITFTGGNAVLDSYDSDDPLYSTGGLYDSAKRKDTGTAGSASIAVDSVTISNSDIWGYVATGGAPPSVGPTGSIKGNDTPPGVKIDPDRITTDFSANFESVTDIPTSFDIEYVAGLVGTSDYTLGTTSTSTSIYAAFIANNSSHTITINGDVTMVVPNDIDIMGNFVITTGSSLTLYVEGDMDVAGIGLTNVDGLPEDLIIYGTNSTVGGQSITLAGNAAVHAAIYAPNATVELKGAGSGGEMSGSVVANDIVVTGNYEFHYDEALRDLGGGNPFSVGSWRELVKAADRVTLY